MKLLKKDIVVYLSDGKELATPNVFRTVNSTQENLISENEKAVADWAFRNNKHAGAATDTLSSAKCLYLAIRVNQNVYGVAGIAVNGTPLDSFENSVLLSILGECALALENIKNAKEKEEAAVLAQNEQLRTNLLRAISHDLRTPLTAISGAAALLLSSEEPRSEKDVSLLNDIKNDAEALTTMVENLLSITRIQDASVPLKKREEMLEEVAGDAVLTTRRRFPDANVQLDLSEDILFLPMEPMLIKQVIVNLLENAVRHSGDTQHIQLHLFRQEEWAVVEVRDHGIGLSPDIMQAVQSGRPLPRDLSGDSTRGMGIGLSVCQSIIKAHGGFFAAGNDPEGGAVFRFGLPMEEKAYE